jgi:hypothetical protein
MDHAQLSAFQLERVFKDLVLKMARAKARSHKLALAGLYVTRVRSTAG